MKVHQSTLEQMAKTINDLAKQESDARLALCRAIAKAMDMVRRESNLSWNEWADQNLRKPDGSKWSRWTLYSYASFGRDPKKLQHVRDSIARRGSLARRALNVAEKTPLASGNDIERQVAALMFAWKGAGNEARKMFLEKISAGYVEKAA